MQRVFASSFFGVEVDEAAKLVRMTRSPKSFTSTEEMQRAHKEVLRAIAPFLQWCLLLDVRGGPARHDADYEKGLASLRKQIVVRFERVAILVKTAVGGLHATRLAREDGVRLRVFQDEELAIEYLSPSKK